MHKYAHILLLLLLLLLMFVLVFFAFSLFWLSAYFFILFFREIIKHKFIFQIVHVHYVMHHTRRTEMHILTQFNSKKWNIKLRQKLKQGVYYETNM